MPKQNPMQTTLKTPLGLARIEGDAQGVSRISITDETPSGKHSAAEEATSPNPSPEALQEASKAPQELQEAVLQLQEYFDGRRTEFSFKTAPRGTDFQKRVWQQLQKIPYGQTCSYLDLAKELGDVKAIRAVASANGKNPLWIVVPCHRVIGTDGSLTGYAGGLWRKKWLLEHENPPNQISLF